MADEADLLFRRGAMLFRDGKHEEALAAFLASNRLARNKNAIYNAGLCFERLGLFNEAFRYLFEYEQEQLSETERAAVRRNLNAVRPKVALVSITATPGGATVFVDRKDLGARGVAPTTLALPPGKHVVILTQEGYEEERIDVSAIRGATTSVVTSLRRVMGIVEVTGTPPGGELRVDRDHGPAVARLPGRLLLLPGRHAIYVSADGHRAARSDVDVVPGQPTRLDVRLVRLPEVPGRLFVTADHPGALVALDGQPVGMTPVFLDVAPGRRRVEVTLEDYAPYVREVVVEPGARLTVAARLAVASEAEVVAASKMAQPVEEAPASISVISGDEIRAFGYRTLAEALGGQRGFFRSDDRMYESIGVRGFGPPGDQNTKFLILRDGHGINEVWTGTGNVGHDFSVDLDDVERILVVRGPGSALYGTGAFFGVVDVTTRLDSERRAEAGLGAGDLGEVYGRVAASGSLGRFAGRLSSSVLYSPRGGRFDDPASGGTIADNDGERAVNVGLKSTYGPFTLLGSFNDRKKILPTLTYDIVPGTGRGAVHDTRAYGEARFERALIPSLQLIARAWYDHSSYDGRWPYGATRDEDLVDSGRADWMGAEVRVVYQLRRVLRVVGGIEGIYAPRVHQEATTAGVSSLDDTRSFAVGSIYALGEYRPWQPLLLSAGVRADYYSTSGLAFSPRAAVVVRPYARGTTKVIFGRAFRAPSIYELYYHDGGVTQVPSPKLKPETVYTVEAEHTHAFGRRFFGTVSLYYNNVQSLIGLQPAIAAGEQQAGVACTNADGCVAYRNGGRVATLGAEAELRRTWGRDGTVAVAYAFQHSRDLEAGPFVGAGATPLVNSPEHIAFLRLGRPLVARYLVLGTELEYGSPRRCRDGSHTDHMFLMNLTLSGRLRDSSLSYSLSVYNLLDWRYGAPVGDEYNAAQIQVRQQGRAFLLRLQAAL